MRQIDKQLLALRFDGQPALYESVTPAQGRMASILLKELTRRLTDHPVRRIVELGCGTGRLTRLLVQQFPAAHVTAFDLAPRMIAHARATCPGAVFIRADAEHAAQDIPAGLDLVVSNAAVQWFANPASTLAQYRALLTGHGCLALTTFGNETFRELRQALRNAHGGPPPPDENEYLLPLPPAGFWREIFPDATIREKILTVEYPDTITFLRALQQAGVNHTGRRRRLLSAPLLRRAIRMYPPAKSSAAASGVAATYHVFCIYVRGSRTGESCRG